MIPLKEWLRSPEVQGIKSKTPGELASLYFFRDPLRAVHLDPNAFYAPADGTIVYAYEKLAPGKPIVTVKGKNFTVRQALDDEEYNYPSIVIGIFMSQWDVHVNRMPTDGFVDKCTKRTPFIYTPNISMITEEEDILQSADIDKDDMPYLFRNERNIVKIYSHDIKGNYYVVQIAEKDVDCALSWGDGDYLNQGERFGQVRFGSQVDLIVPLTGKVKYEMLAKVKYHVEAGIDKLLRIIK